MTSVTSEIMGCIDEILRYNAVAADKLIRPYIIMGLISGQPEIEQH